MVIVFCTICMTGFSQTINSNWKRDVEASLEEFTQCEGAACQAYTGKVLNTIYKVNDFYSSQLNRYLTASEIADFLKSATKWSDLGKPYEQKTLDAAQEYANAKKAVVAVFQNSQGIGHVVIITPGELSPSGSWGLKVPNAASFFAAEPQKSFVDKALSFAFTKNMIKDVTIYGRNY